MASVEERGGDESGSRHVRVLDERYLLRMARVFYLSLFFAFIAILLLVGGGFYSFHRVRIVKMAEGKAVELGRYLLHRNLLSFTSPAKDGELLIESGEYAALDHSMREYLSFFGLEKIKVYDRYGLIIYSNDPTVVGRVDRKNAELRRALGGEMVTTVVKGGNPLDLEAESPAEKDLVETYFPIRDRHGHVVGAFEIYIDVTPFRVEMHRNMAFYLAMVALVMLIVFLAVALIVRKLLRVIGSQVDELKVLSGILPICSYCKKIRNPSGGWETVEQYIHKRSESDFSHSICPVCLEVHYPGLGRQEGEGEK